MVPSKPEDFTAAHPGFEGQEEGLADLLSIRSVAEALDERGHFAWSNTATAGGWRYRLLHILERVGPDQPPSDGL